MAIASTPIAPPTNGERLTLDHLRWYYPEVRVDPNMGFRSAQFFKWPGSEMVSCRIELENGFGLEASYAEHPAKPVRNDWGLCYRAACNALSRWNFLERYQHHQNNFS